MLPKVVAAVPRRTKARERKSVGERKRVLTWRGAARSASQGKLAEAEVPYTESIEIRKKTLGEDHPAIAQALNNLASLLKAQVRGDGAVWKMATVDSCLCSR